MKNGAPLDSLAGQRFLNRARGTFLDHGRLFNFVVFSTRAAAER